MSDTQRPESDHPLGLTVYDLPSPQDVAQADAKRTAMGRLRMVIVLLVCAAPVVASYFTYYVVRPEGRRNFGQWLLVSVSGGACTQDCQTRLYLQRQVLTGLGKDRPRTEWVWLIDDAEPVPAELLPGLKEATVLRVDATALHQWLAPASGQTLSDHLYLVDPHGQWMMRFPPQLSAEGALKAKRDIER